MKTSHKTYSEGKKIKPTNKQAQASIRVCQMLSNGYLDIRLFRFDNNTGNIFIMAGETIEVIIPPDGEWYFYETRL